MTPEYPVYVISKGRYDCGLTARWLLRDKVPFVLVVEPQEADLYAKEFDRSIIRVLPFSNLGKGSYPARNWCWEDAKAAGHERHWILDDNIRCMFRRWKTQRLNCEAGIGFKAVEEFTDRYENVAIAGMAYAFFVPEGHSVAPYFLNCHVYSCMLIRCDLPYRWRLRYNEDTDLCLQVLTGGWCTLLFNAFLVKKQETMTMKGGNSTELYKGDGRLKMSKMLERMWPGVVYTERRFHRPQHKIMYQWGHFDTPLVRKPDYNARVAAAPDWDKACELRQFQEPKSEKIRALVGAHRELQETGVVSYASKCAGAKSGRLGKLRPWVWSIELVRGCNLSCWHCTARIFPEDGVHRFMPVNTWGNLCEVMARNSPGRRLEMAQGGEPTLHPHLLDILRIAKNVSPTTQVQVTTNGLNLQNGRYSFRELFDAGANSVYVDMYAPFEKYQKMAEESGAEWYHYNRPGVGNTERRANAYYGDPKMRLIILQDSPIDRIRWRKMGRLSTFLNHIDWPVAMPFGLVPVRETYKRKCTLPMRYVSTTWEGDYLFCCMDFWGESAGQLGNVNDGPEAFEQFWLGRLMQSIRRRLVAADRAGVPYCSRCNCAFSKCDWTHIWPADSYERYKGSNGEWISMPQGDDDVFADGWAKAKALVIPTQAEEDECLRTSTRRVINTRDATRKGRPKLAPCCPVIGKPSGS